MYFVSRMLLSGSCPEIKVVTMDRKTPAVFVQICIDQQKYNFQGAALNNEIPTVSVIQTGWIRLKCTSLIAFSSFFSASRSWKKERLFLQNIPSFFRSHRYTFSEQFIR